MAFSGHGADLWAAADRCFDQFPPRLFEDLSLLRHNLATAASQTGQLQDVLAGPADEPWLALPGWLLADLGADADARAALEGRLTLAMLCSFMAAAALEGAAGRDAPELAARLGGEATGHFAAILPDSAPFWAHHRACWDAHGAAQSAYDSAGLPAAAGRLAPLRLGGIAAAFALGRPDLAQPLEAICDQLGLAFEIWRELEALQRDAGGGRSSPVLRRVLGASGATGPASKERLLAGLVFGGAAGALGREGRAAAVAAEAVAAEAGLPSLAEHCRQVAAAMDGLLGRFGLRAGPAAPDRGGRTFAFAPPPTTVAAASLAAEEYLLADLSFRESWDVQRTGLLDQAAVIGRPFPAGSIVEILCRHGHALGAQVDQIFALLAANGFCYFDQPGLLPPDADDLGLLLRLFRFSGQQPAHRGLLAEPLRLFEEHMRPSGAIPVWLQAPERGAGAPFALWGDDCIAVQAQFLIGLLDYDAAGYAERIGRGAAYVCARVVEAGLGANRYYAPLYGLWAVSELVRRLGRTAGGAVAAARAALATRLDCAAAAAESPQDLALLILSASAQGRSGQPPTSGSPAAWADRLIAAQRYDGGWRDEPLYITGDRGGRAGWYSSRAFTTALCYHALKSLDYS